MRRARALLLLVALAASGGCNSMEHVLDLRHPWHSVPTARIGGAWMLAMLPVALVEEVTTGRSFHGVVTPMVMLPGVGVGMFVGGVLDVALHPLELVFPVDDGGSSDDVDSGDAPSDAPSDASDEPPDTQDAPRVPDAGNVD